MRSAVIDIGSNSVRLMLHDGNESVYKTGEVTQLSQDLAYNNTLRQDAIERTAIKVVEFVGKARQYNPKAIYIFATEAVRSAKNAVDFTERIYGLTGLRVHILTTAEEAALAFSGAVGFNKKRVGVIDIGGASVEIAYGIKGVIEYSKSCPVGTVRLKDSRIDTLDVYKFLSGVLTFFGSVECSSFYAVGGTALSLAAISREQSEFDLFAIENTSLSIAFVKKIADKMLAMTPDQIFEAYPVVGSKRASVIKYGAALMYSAMEHLEIKNITVTTKDNLEGYLEQFSKLKPNI